MEQSYPELAAFLPGEGWEADPAGDMVRVELGPGRPWQTLTELLHFLRSVVGEPRVSRLRGAWLGCDESGQAAQPLSEVATAPLPTMAPSDATKLLPILEQGRIETWFQPLFDARTLDLWGYECLARARDDGGKLINPSDLLSWARQEQLLFTFDRVCRETHLINAGRAGLPAHARVLINFMPTAIYDAYFCLRTTVAAASKHGLDPERIIFEVVESEQINDREHLNSILGFYRRNGFGVALDDVGSGSSGLMLLADLNPDLIKLDRVLVQKAARSRPHRSVCRALVELGHENGRPVLAEGVETAEEQAVMESVGVDLFQGFRFGRPSPEPATEPLVAA